MNLFMHIHTQNAHVAYKHVYMYPHNILEIRNVHSTSNSLRVLSCLAILFLYDSSRTMRPPKISTFIFLLNPILHLKYCLNWFTHTTQFNEPTVLIRILQRNRTNRMWGRRGRGGRGRGKEGETYLKWLAHSLWKLAHSLYAWQVNRPETRGRADVAS